MQGRQAIWVYAGVVGLAAVLATTLLPIGPGGTQAAVAPATLLYRPVQPSFLFYTVRVGDTVAGIAQRFHDVAWLLRRRNGGLWTLTPGQTIRVWHWPFGHAYTTTLAETTDRPTYYTVASGDTLDVIATRLHVGAATLALDNHLGSGSLIYAGQRLTLHHYTVRRHTVTLPAVPAERLSAGLLLTDLANLTGTDAALVKGLSWHETAWHNVRGASGEYGMMQIMPYMTKWVQRSLLGYPLDPTIAVNNTLDAMLLLRYYLDITHGDAHRALALYHSGNTAASRRNGLYIRAVLSLRAYFYAHPTVGL